MSAVAGAVLPACSVRSYGPDAVSHSHDHHQLILPIDGCLRLETEAAGGRVTGLRAAAVVAGLRHSYSAPGANRFAVIDWPQADEATAALWERLCQRPYFALGPGLHHALAWLAAQERAGAVWRRRWAGLVVLSLAQRPDDSRVGDDAAVQRLDAALRHVRDHLAEAIGPRELARAAGLSRSRLHALFRVGLGTTPMRYLREQRLEAAARLLRETRCPIAEVAQAAGFSDQSALTRHFHHHFGVTPTGYRRDRQH